MPEDFKVKEWSSKRLQAHINNELLKTLENILNFSEVAVGDEGRYKVLRSKILRLMNDSIRNICSEIESKYEVTFSVREDIIKVVNKDVKKEVREGRNER